MEPIIRQGDHLEVFVTSSIAASFTAFAQIRYDDNGEPDILIVPERVHAGDSAQQHVSSESVAKRNATVVAATIMEIGTTEVLRGQMYGTLAVTWRFMPIARGYLYDGHAVVLGENVETGPTGGQGFIRSITGTNPAAGVEISETVPTDLSWRLIALDVVIVAGSAAFNPQFVITDGTTEKWRSSLITVAGSATERMILAQVGTRLEAATSILSLPAGMILRPGYVIETTGISADDDYAAPELLVEQWLEI